MAHLEKYKVTGVVNNLRHIERTIVNSSNLDIDRERTKLNYSLAPDRGMSSYSYFLKRKGELYCMNRQDIVVMAGWIATAPQELPPCQYEAFFQAVNDFLTERYGIENTIASVVHLDETTPHIHYYFIPAVDDKKHGGMKICANELLTRAELRDFHPALQKYLNDNTDIQVSLLNGAVKAQGGNRSVLKMKKERRLKLQYKHEQYDTQRGRW